MKSQVEEIKWGGVVGGDVSFSQMLSFKRHVDILAQTLSRKTEMWELEPQI